MEPTDTEIGNKLIETSTNLADILAGVDDFSDAIQGKEPLRGKQVALWMQSRCLRLHTLTCELERLWEREDIERRAEDEMQQYLKQTA